MQKFDMYSYDTHKKASSTSLVLLCQSVTWKHTPHALFPDDDYIHGNIQFMIFICMAVAHKETCIPLFTLFISSFVLCLKHHNKPVFYCKS